MCRRLDQSRSLKSWASRRSWPRRSRRPVRRRRRSSRKRRRPRRLLLRRQRLPLQRRRRLTQKLRRRRKPLRAVRSRQRLPMRRQNRRIKQSLLLGVRPRIRWIRRWRKWNRRAADRSRLLLTKRRRWLLNQQTMNKLSQGCERSKCEERFRDNELTAWSWSECLAEKKLRVHNLGKELNVDNKVIIEKCRAEGIELKGHM